MVLFCLPYQLFFLLHPFTSASARKTILLLEKKECICLFEIGFEISLNLIKAEGTFKEYVSKKTEAIFRIKEQSSEMSKSSFLDLKFDHNERFKLFFVSVRRKKN